ncbi:MAG: DUF1311 domain-containing protein [Pseudodesulfovibrio sp.]|nr:DUF1311 domain-containing protein [Pseudodesulfovibrio sp.]
MNKCLSGVLAISSAGIAQNEYRTMVEDTQLTHSEAVGIMNSMIAEIHKLYSEQPEFLAKFDASQKAWKQYRQLHIQAQYPGSRENYGSSFSFCGPNESLRLVKERVGLIKQWIIGTIEGNVCCGTIRWISEEEYEKAIGQEIPTSD